MLEFLENSWETIALIMGIIFQAITNIINTVKTPKTESEKLANKIQKAEAKKDKLVNKIVKQQEKIKEMGEK